MRHIFLDLTRRSAPFPRDLRRLCALIGAMYPPARALVDDDGREALDLCALLLYGEAVNGLVIRRNDIEPLVERVNRSWKQRGCGMVWTLPAPFNPKEREPNGLDVLESFGLEWFTGWWDCELFSGTCNEAATMKARNAAVELLDVIEQVTGLGGRRNLSNAHRVNGLWRAFEAAFSSSRVPKQDMTYRLSQGAWNMTHVRSVPVAGVPRHAG